MVAARPGQRTPLTSSAANRKTQILRAAVDAIAVGSETLLVDDPLLTVRECHRVRPLARVVFDRRLRTPVTARVFSTLSDGPVIILTGAINGPLAPRALALEAAGAVVREVATLAEGLQALAGVGRVDAAGRGRTALQSAFCQAGLVDRVHLIIAPQMLGPAGVPWLDADDVRPGLGPTDPGRTARAGYLD